jgi:hypothetical protein
MGLAAVTWLYLCGWYSEWLLAPLTRRKWIPCVAGAELVDAG